MELDYKAREAIEEIIMRREGAASMQAQIKEDTKSVAGYLAIKPAQVAKIIGLVERKWARGNIIKGEHSVMPCFP